MLLTVDVGNTNITLGLFKEDKVYATFRITTQVVRTSDEFGSLIAEMIARKGININSINRTDPREVGSDRIVDAVAAYELYGGPCIVIDFGTATTYDLVSGDGTLEAAVTAPGIKICAKALWNETAKLPEIEIKKPASILAKDTITSMQAGIVYGYIGQSEYIIDKMKRESGLDNIKVIATGGMGRIIYENTDKIDIYDNQLTLQGMKIIYEKNKK